MQTALEDAIFLAFAQLCIRVFPAFVSVEVNKGKHRGRVLQQLSPDLLTLLKMTYQITQRTGFCPCSCYSLNPVIVLHSRGMQWWVMFEKLYVLPFCLKEDKLSLGIEKRARMHLFSTFLHMFINFTEFTVFLSLRWLHNQIKMKLS